MIVAYLWIATGLVLMALGIFSCYLLMRVDMPKKDAKNNASSDLYRRMLK